MDYSVDGDDYSDSVDISDDSSIDVAESDDSSYDCESSDLDAVPDIEDYSSGDVDETSDDIPEDGEYNDEIAETALLDEIPETEDNESTTDVVDDEIPADYEKNNTFDIEGAEHNSEGYNIDYIQESSDEAISAELGKEENEAILEDILDQESSEEVSDTYSDMDAQDTGTAVSEMETNEANIEDGSAESLLEQSEEIENAPELSETDNQNIDSTTVDISENAETSEPGKEESEALLAEILDKEDSEETLDASSLAHSYDIDDVDSVVDDIAADYISDTSGEIISEIKETSDEVIDSLDNDEGFDKAAFNDLTEYMSSHDYQKSDFNEYSKDPEWRDIVSRAFPEYELPSLDTMGAKNRSDVEDQTSDDYQESFSIPDYEEKQTPGKELTEYMHRHNYGRDDFDIYSKDPEWQELVRRAFPECEMPEGVDSVKGSALDSGLRAIDRTAEALEDDLRDKGFKDIGIKAFVDIEKDRLRQELSDNLNGDFSNPYEKPDFQGTHDEIEFGKTEYDFSEEAIDYNSEEYVDITHPFLQENWENLTQEERAGCIFRLRDYICPMLDQEQPPDIEIYNTCRKGDYGYYNRGKNTIYLNEYTLDDGPEAVDTLAHELWHKHQYFCGEQAEDLEDAKYIAAFELYTRPDMDAEKYGRQLIESEARAFARHITKGIR